MVRVYTLYRVSTVGQVDHDDIPMQRIACREFVDSQPDWEIYIRFWQASGESEKTSIRVRAKHQQMVLAGEYRGGLVPFGFDAVYLGRVNKKNKPVKDLVRNEEEAAIKAECYHKIVDEGYGGNRLANWLNERGPLRSLRNVAASSTKTARLPFVPMAAAFLPVSSIAPNAASACASTTARRSARPATARWNTTGTYTAAIEK